MEKFEMRNLPAANLKDGSESIWPLSSKRGKDNSNAYKLYFYLLSRSAVSWGRKDLGEKTYYYITDNQKYWKKSEAAKTLGCTARTISNNLARLVEEGLLIKTTTGYQFADLRCWVPVHWDIMKCFMGLGESVNWETMIRFYAILLYAKTQGVEEFTLTDIYKTLHVNGNEENLFFFKMCLQWWSQLGLISYETKQVSLGQLGKYTLYILLSIRNTPTKAAIELVEDLEGGPTTEMWTRMIEQAKLEE